MTIELLVKKLNKEVGTLKREVQEMKQILFASQKDTEGEYRKSFVKKILAREKEEACYRFTTKENFLKELHGRKK